MTNLQIAYLEFAIVGGLGVALVVAAVLSRAITKSRNQLCVAQTKGTVVAYSYVGEGRVRPVIAFSVDGKNYTTKKKYNGIKWVHVSGLPVEEEIWEDRKGYLHIKTGRVANLYALGERIWPMGSTVEVFYRPDRPKNNYVDRPVTNRFVFGMFLIMGFVTIGIGALVFFLIR